MELEPPIVHPEYGLFDGPADENWWFALFLDEIRACLPALPRDPAAIARHIAPKVRALSDALTRQRALPSQNYLEQESYFAAYAFYYLPLNFHKSRPLMRLATTSASTSADSSTGTITGTSTSTGASAGTSTGTSTSTDSSTGTSTSTSTKGEDWTQVAARPAGTQHAGPNRLRVLDLGCGPGTQLWALLAELLTGSYPSRSQGKTPTSTAGEHQTGQDAERQRLEVRYQGIDQSQRALDWVKKMANRVLTQPETAQALSLELDLRRQALDRFAPQNEVDLIIAGNVLNELFEESRNRPELLLSWIDRLWDTLAPGGTILLLEPAFQTSSATLERIREHLLRRPECHILSPCTHRVPCPLLPDGSAGEQNKVGRPSKQWCHQELRWQRPPWIQTIDALTGLDQRNIALSHLLVRKKRPGTSYTRGTDASERSLRYRALSPALKGKGTLSLHLCGPEGFQEALLLTRHETPLNASTRDVRRGDALTLVDAEVKKGQIRIEAKTKVAVEPLQDDSNRGS